MNIHQTIRTICYAVIAISFVFITYFEYQKTQINRQQVVATTISSSINNQISELYRAMVFGLMIDGFSLEEIYDRLYDKKIGRFITKSLNKGISLEKIQSFLAKKRQELIAKGRPQKEVDDFFYDKFGFNFAYDAESEDNKE